MTTQKAVLRAAAILFRVVLTVVIVLGIISMGQTTYRFTRAVFCDAAIEEAPGRTVKIQIKEEVSAKKLAKVLEENGLVENALVFQMQMKLEDFEGTVQPGSYELNTSMSPSSMLKVLSETDEDNK